ncbi:hypothetical protein DFQ27_002457 [Actinomortierella ambigua]|uniref:Uncharacterized protein n=1 Tax=Actinomortierella ambigua TaxID=1343610 RepID=A0A9P6Q7M0_9FUNG|nr:hypothetical protein DFQ27_002457 [Actinomortierella ambigua]
MAANCTAPFQEQSDNEKVASMVLNGQRETLPLETPLAHRQPVQRCWKRDLSKRPEVINMVVMDGGDTTKISSGGHEMEVDNPSLPSDGAAAATPIPVQSRVAFLFFCHQAKNGDSDALFKLAVKCKSGNEVRQSDDIAFSLFRHAAVQGHVQAQCICSVSESNKTVARPLSWFRKAAEQGLASARYSVGALYELGRGGGGRVPQDYAMAVLWYRQSANAGYTDAQRRLRFTLVYQHTTVSCSSGT